MDTLAAATILAALVLVASMASVELGISVAIAEIALGVFAGNVLGITSTPWIDFLAAFAGILLTFLAARRSIPASFVSASASQPSSAVSRSLCHSRRPDSSPTSSQAGTFGSPRSRGSLCRPRRLRSCTPCSSRPVSRTPRSGK
jgi:hypothetical protein